MPLDPQTRAVLDEIAALGLPAYETLPAAEARATYRRVTLARRGPAFRPEAVADSADHSAPGPAGPIPVRCYTPEGAGPFPLIVYFHGGGWVVGDLDTHDPHCRTLCRRTGAVVVSVDYRLAPEHPYPAAVHDAFAATRWAVAHASTLGADPERTAVAGDSAGGNLAAAVALAARDGGDPSLRAQGLVYPVLDASLSQPSMTALADGYGLTAETMRWYVEQYVPDPARRAEPLCSPLGAPELVGLPPAVLVTAEFDPLRDEGEAYARRLQEAGVEVSLTRLDGLVHGFLGMITSVAAADRATDALSGELARLLR